MRKRDRVGKCLVLCAISIASLCSWLAAKHPDGAGAIYAKARTAIAAVIVRQHKAPEIRPLSEDEIDDRERREYVEEISYSRLIRLPVRSYDCVSGVATNHEMEPIAYNHSYESVDLGKTAIVLMDCWNMRPTPYNETLDTEIVPLLEFARRNSVNVVHSPNGRPIYHRLEPDADNPYEYNVVKPWVSDAERLDRYLKERGINTILYAGYATNACVFYRATGMHAMRNRGYETILLRDLTRSMETSESRKAGLWGYKYALDILERTGCTTTFNEFQAAVAAGNGEE